MLKPPSAYCCLTQTQTHILRKSLGLGRAKPHGTVYSDSALDQDSKQMASSLLLHSFRDLKRETIHNLITVCFNSPVPNPTNAQTQTGIGPALDRHSGISFCSISSESRQEKNWKKPCQLGCGGNGKEVHLVVL